ncbi:hypothetical protein [Vibrio rarus]|uniref:hypothetical protein n=1 Tax=Vibrio rarus TaxID=413403 RepID=UPI0021C46A7D|nr:hypothetical protein [Vibrio rarus]
MFSKNDIVLSALLILCSCSNTVPHDLNKKSDSHTIDKEKSYLSSKIKNDSHSENKSNHVITKSNKHEGKDKKHKSILKNTKMNNGLDNKDNKDNKDKKIKNKVHHIAPPLPEPMPPITAPKRIGHPLANSTKIIFMLGEDSQGYYLYGEGMIVKGTYDKFLRYINYYNKKGINLNRIMMHSPGGLMNEAIKIGTYMQEHQWGAASDKYMKCYSACGIIYASGVFKQIQSGAEIGFHRPYDPNKADTEKFKRHIYNIYKPYWNYIGGNEELYNDFMNNYGRDQMLILTEDNISNFMKVERIK